MMPASTLTHFQYGDWLVEETETGCGESRAMRASKIAVNRCSPHADLQHYPHLHDYVCWRVPSDSSWGFRLTAP